MPHCAPYPTQSWPTDPNTFQLPQTHTGDSSYFGEINNLTPVATPSGLASSINTSIPNNGLAGDAFHETERASERQLQEDLSQSMSPPSFYVVTGEYLNTIAIYPSWIHTNVYKKRHYLKFSMSSTPCHLNPKSSCLFRLNLQTRFRAQCQYSLQAPPMDKTSTFQSLTPCHYTTRKM